MLAQRRQGRVVVCGARMDGWESEKHGTDWIHTYYIKRARVFMGKMSKGLTCHIVFTSILANAVRYFSPSSRRPSSRKNLRIFFFFLFIPSFAEGFFFFLAVGLVASFLRTRLLLVFQ